MSDKTILFVSIIIPVYNAEKTVRDCLKSVFTSEYTNFEVVLVDDNSTDDSLSIFRFVLKERGAKFTIKTILMNWFSYLYSGAGLVIGFFSF